MWRGPDQDPGGGSDPGGPPPASSQELSDLKDQYEQQQVLIAQLKEMIRKNEQSNVTQEKVDEYMNTLTKMSARAKKGKTKAIGKVEESGNKKVSLLRQQLEENRARLAERGKSQKGIEDMVTQLQAQIDGSQQLINQNPLNVSLADTTKTDYTPETSSAELYAILLSKEKRVSDLLSKVQKLESNVLDLQENVKEKDSVIDARTKAITLMTENLSKKSKSTLDTLDDTKEQMRHMQENFVSLETEMKARQMKLLEDLRQKNYEIAELQDVNTSLRLDSEKSTIQDDEADGRIEEYEQKVSTVVAENERLLHFCHDLEESVTYLSKENTNLQETIKEHDKKSEELSAENSRLLEKVQESEQLAAENSRLLEKTKDLERAKVVKDEAEDDEVARLRKQLDESNKNMIKVKAQHKSKVKDLSKKLDAFKKVSDANAEIVKLEAENCKLSQKIAELEEEKGSLQLKIVESESGKGSEGSDMRDEEREHFEFQLLDLAKKLEEKDQFVVSLTTEIETSKAEIENLNEKLAALSHLQNAQVTSEMTSIRFEEQLDEMEREKRRIDVEKEELAKLNEELLEKIETLTKEKSDISSKLEAYIQENIELIDKLEKLSAEKVSSAESIEIVEGLTQQEKLELEEYQKSLDAVNSGNLKASEENLQQNVDLNESVNELTEETSELLQKIELFTVERREVMDKMEQLKQENSDLILRVREIENNRDVLAETYEQLQNEKEALDAKMEELLDAQKQRQQSEGSSEEISKAEITSLQEKLKAKEDQIETLNNTVVELMSQAEVRKTELNFLQEQLAAKEKQIEDLNTSVAELLSEAETHKTELVSFQEGVEARESQIEAMDSTVGKLTTEVEQLQIECKVLEEELNAVFKDKEEFELELQKAGRERTEAVMSEHECRRLLESRENELAKMAKERENMRQAMAEKDETFHKVTLDLKEKYLGLQKRLEENSGSIAESRAPLEARIEELTQKNRDQLEKMRKIAANLKKKVQAHQELEATFHQSKEKWELELAEKDAKIKGDQEHVSSLLQQMQELEAEVTRLREEAAHVEKFKYQKIEEVSVLEGKNVELQNAILELRGRMEKMGDEKMSLQQELMQTHENIAAEDRQSSSEVVLLQSKVQELEMIVETQDFELTKYKERVTKLEEGISFVEERRMSLERRANELGAQLEEKSQNFDEVSKTEDELERRLIALTAQDEMIARKLEEAVLENQELTQQNQELTTKTEKLKRKLEQVLKKAREAASSQGVIEELETKNEELKQRVHHLEGEVKHLQIENHRLIQDSSSEIDKANSDWQSQFDEVSRERTELLIQCEKLVEQIAERDVVLANEIADYQAKADQEKAIEVDSCKQQILELQEFIQKLQQETKVEADELTRQLEEAELERKKLTEELGKVMYDLQTTKGNLNVSLASVEDLKAEVAHLEEELLKKTAERTVTAILDEAESRLSPPEETVEHSALVEISTEPQQQQILERQEASKAPAKQQRAVIFQQPYAQGADPIPEQHQQHQIEEVSTVQAMQPMAMAAVFQQPYAQDAIPEISVTQPTPDTPGVIPAFVWSDHQSHHDPFDFVQTASTSAEPSSDVQQSFFQSALEGVQDFFTFDQTVGSGEHPHPHGQIQHMSSIPEEGQAEGTTQAIQATQETQDASNQTQATHHSETNEELLNKVKTLEFMLFTVEKEKEDAMLQCHELSNELARLVYERENKAADAEGQIVQDVPDHSSGDLRQLEFTPTHAFPTASTEAVGSKPVEEEPVQAKQAYLCYASDDENNQELSTSRDVDSHILSSSDVERMAENREELRNLEFEPSGTPECLAQAKSAYLCFEGENDDGWGWSPEEAQLEAQQSPQIEFLREKMRVLELERDNHLEEIKQLQIKSGKLIRKLKEFKMKNEELVAKSKRSDDMNLDDAIQEELKLQVAQAEKRLKEKEAELERERAERNSVAKRVDVLTVANERMVEMKEKQDVELMGWQRNCRELNAKLERLEWGNDGFEEEKVQQASTSRSEAVPVQRVEEKDGDEIRRLNEKIAELNDTIKDVMLDNEELQALLEEQRELRLKAERTKPAEPTPVQQTEGFTRTEAEFLRVVGERDALHHQVGSLVDERDATQVKLMELHSHDDAKNQEMAQLRAQIADLERARAAEAERAKLQAAESVEKLTRTEAEYLRVLEESDQYYKQLLVVVEQRDEAEQRCQQVVQLQSHISDLEKLRVTEEEQNIQLRNRITELEGKLASEISKVHTSNEEIVQLQNRIAELQGAMTEENQRLLSMAEERALHLQTRVGELEQQLAAELQNAAESQKLLQDEVNELVRKNEALVAEKLQLQAVVAEMEAAAAAGNQSEADDKKKLQGELNEVIKRHDELAVRFEAAEHERVKLEELLANTRGSSEQLVAEKDAQIEALNASLNAQLTELRAQLATQHEAQQRLEAKLATKDEEFAQVVAQWAQRVEERGTGVAESWKLHLDARETEFAQLEAALRKEINELEEKCNALVNENNELRKNVDAEIRNEVDRVAALQQQITDRQQYISELSLALNEKQGDIERLQREIETVKVQLTSEAGIVDGVLEVLEGIVANREKEEVTAAITAWKEEVAALRTQLHELHSLKEYESENIQNLQQTLRESQQLNGELEAQLLDKSARLEEAQRLLQDREAKLAAAQLGLEEKRNEFEYTVEHLRLEARTTSNEQAQEIETLKRRILDTENHYEELLTVKDNDLATIQGQVSQQSANLDALTGELTTKEERLQVKLQECDDLHATIDEQNAVLEEERKQLLEQQTIIENQVLKIEQLKQELYAKSNDYDSLIAELDISRTDSRQQQEQQQQQQDVASSTAEAAARTNVSRREYEEEDLSEPVSRAELDLALYMLHQRDVRCEELTVELTQLLEERDTLQLRLSNAIREREDMRRRRREGDVASLGEDTPASVSFETSPPATPSSSGAVPRAQHLPETSDEAGGERLATKLSELRSVSYKKDKTLVDDQEARRLQALSIMQQHRDVASRLPPEAAARLVDASYTLSRDVQSPSKVLLNWLWGRSTPKVNNI